MSIQFSDTSTYKGLVQFYERELGFNRGFISGNTDKLKEFTADCNLAGDNFLAIALPAGGEWQVDDTNHGDFPIIKTNILSGQADYTFTSDEGGNLVLDIFKVLALPDATSSIYDELRPVDQQQARQFDVYDDIAQEVGTTGTAWRYDKTANGIILDPIPNYNATSGLKVYINREASYFVSTDTTKKPGFDGRLHEYFYLRPALEYARRHGLDNERKLKEKVLEVEAKIEEVYGGRGRDTIERLVPDPIQYE